MATKIRLQRHGRKGYAFYHIVIADSRAPRDGKFIERIGSYNPNTNPATIDLNFERALYWLQVGAQPTDTTRNVLSSKGVFLMKHLLGGVKKGAFSEAEAQTKFQNWVDKKSVSESSVSSKNSEAARAEEKARFDAEKEVNKAKAAALAAKKAEKAAALVPVEEVAPVADEVAPVVETAAPAEEAAASEEEASTKE